MKEVGGPGDDQCSGIHAIALTSQLDDEVYTDAGRHDLVRVKLPNLHHSSDLGDP